MFIDEVKIVVKGGRGGDGKVSFFPGKNGPDGGNGGQGGDVYAILNTNFTNLNKYIDKKLFKAGDGESGGSYRCTGMNGQDLDIQVPLGTFIIDEDSQKEVEITRENPKVLLSQGGVGGRGNDAFKSATHQTPRQAEKGLEGQERHLKMILKLIADFGLIGLPNAGKSSLLNELTAANVKTASYPFTTLEPNLGVSEGKIIADIPGLIEGASKGRGLGIKFLKHIEKVKLLFHCISVESENLLTDYEVVIKELAQYNPELLKKQMIILLTKIDLVDKEKAKEKIEVLKKLDKEILPISIHDWDSLQNMKKLMAKY